MVEFKDIVKTYDEKFQINIPHMVLNDNKIYGLLGHNGAGKTTTIRMLLGLLKPDCGTILIEGQDVFKSNKIKKDIGYIPDVPNLFEKLTGFEHLNFVSSLYGFNSKENIQYIEEFMELFEIEKDKDKIISSYSKGMKQKISIISALIIRPQILILDEPFTGLDPIAIQKFIGFLNNFINQEKRLILLSTHDLHIVDDICTDSLIMKNGQIISQINLKESKKNIIQDIFFKQLGNSGESI